MTAVVNDVAFVRTVVRDLRSAGFRPLVFGGWAEELLGVRPAGVHTDVDLLLVEPDLDRLTAYLAGQDEIEDKRFSHKRAFMLRGVLIELFLIEAGSSVFWDNLRYEWPDLTELETEGLPIAPIDALNAYRRDYDMIRAAAPRLG